MGEGGGGGSKRGRTKICHTHPAIMKLEKFFEYLKIVFINMFTIWMMSAKMVTLGLPKIKVL